MSNKDTFKILDARSHVRKRIQVYLGSPNIFTTERFVLGKWKEVTYVPALVKAVNEIVDNSVDEAIRTSFKFSNRIDVTVQGNTVSVLDNGRGIPQDEIEDLNGEKIVRPIAAWVRTNAGSNFEDEGRTTQGMNGVGAACANFVSAKFVGETWRDGKKITVTCSEGAENVSVDVTKMKGNGTKVTLTPDFELFDAENLDEGDTLSLIHDRMLNLQVAFPQIDFTFNGEKLPGKRFKDYAAQYSEYSVIEASENISFVIFPSEDGFRSNSFVNGLNTHEGGTHIDFVIGHIVDELVIMIKRKFKIEVSKSTIRGGLSIVMFVRDFTNPRFNSQTKEKFTSPWGQFKTHYDATDLHDFKHIAKQIMNNPVLIDPIVAAQLAKKLADEKRDEAKAKKGMKKIKVAKHVAATGDNATLLLVEGDSALGFGIEVRDPKKIGMYPLRGVVMNTWNMKPVEVLKNKELSELVAILGLDISDPESIDNMTYGTISTLADADHDGEHIATLLCAFFYKFWPRLFSEGRFRITRSPIMITEVKGKKDDIWSFGYLEAEENKANNPTANHRYIKGLASLELREYDRIINNPKQDTITVDDKNLFEIMFGASADERKKFMML